MLRQLAKRNMLQPSSTPGQANEESKDDAFSEDGSVTVFSPSKSSSSATPQEEPSKSRILGSTVGAYIRANQLAPNSLGSLSSLASDDKPSVDDCFIHDPLLFMTAFRNWAPSAAVSLPSVSQ